MKNAGWWGGATLALVLAILLAWRNASDPAESASPDRRTAVQSKASGELPSRQSDSARRSAAPRAVVGARPKLMGDVVTVLEGNLTETGSEEPVKIRTINGEVISAASVAVGADKTVRLNSPVQVETEGGGSLVVEHGSVVLSADGSFKTEMQGTISFAPKPEPLADPARE